MKRKDSILLLNRLVPPWMGMWNGIGGKLEPGESPKEGILREVAEETGLTLPDVADRGMVTWTVDGQAKGGMHLFTAELPAHTEYATPRGVEEGILDWKAINWILHPANQGVATNLPFFLPLLLSDTRRYDHRCTFENGRLTAVRSVLFEEGRQQEAGHSVG